MVKHLQVNQTRLRAGVSGTTSPRDDISQVLSSGANDRTVETSLNWNSEGDLILKLLRDSRDGCSRSGDSLLGSSESDSRVTVRVVASLVDVDLRIGVVLDLVDGSSASSEDTSYRSGGDREFDRVVVVLLILDSLRESR